MDILTQIHPLLLLTIGFKNTALFITMCPFLFFARPIGDSYRMFIRKLINLLIHKNPSRIFFTALREGE